MVVTPTGTVKPSIELTLTVTLLKVVAPIPRTGPCIVLALCTFYILSIKEVPTPTGEVPIQFS